MAWPLMAGLALASMLRLAYDPVLPDALLSRLPASIAVLEPTVPTVIALVVVAWWALRPRESVADEEVSTALQALGWAVRIVLATAIVLYLLLGRIYDLEGGYWLWRAALACALYAGMMWIGIEGAHKGFIRWPLMFVAATSIIATLAWNLALRGQAI